MGITNGMVERNEKTWLSLVAGMRMGMNSWEREGVRLKRHSRSITTYHLVLNHLQAAICFPGSAFQYRYSVVYVLINYLAAGDSRRRYFNNNNIARRAGSVSLNSRGQTAGSAGLYWYIGVGAGDKIIGPTFVTGNNPHLSAAVYYMKTD